MSILCGEFSHNKLFISAKTNQSVQSPTCRITKMPKPRNLRHPSEHPRLKPYVSTWLFTGGISWPLGTPFPKDSEAGL